MQLPDICIRRPVFATMMNLALVLFGAIGLSRLPVRELPDIDPPIVSVTTVYPGAAPGVVETEVTERLEDAINTIEGIKTLTSQSREQVSSITIEFNLSRPIEVATQDVRDRVSSVRGRLPEDILDPVVAKQDADARPMLWIGMNSDRLTPLEMTTLAEKQIKNRLQTVPGVSSIFIGGEQRFAMRLWLDAERMAAHQITVLDVQRALREQNVELPSGRVENVDREMTIQTQGELKTVEEFNRLVVARQGDRVVRLQDIGEAREGVENERTHARNLGKPCIFLGVVKNSKANTVEVAEGIKRELELIRPTLPAGIELNINYDESVYVERAITEVWETLAIAFALVVVVIYVFLHNFRATLIPAVAIPVSIVANFVVLYWLGFSVNILTMLALVLAIGVVVDDAIVVLENIHRHIEEGQTPMQAAFLGMKEITFAVIATTVALVAVFIPLAFQTSTTGRLFVEFAMAIAGSVIISSFVALTLTPMMSARVLRRVEKKPGSLVRGFERAMHALASGYERLLGRVLRLSAWTRAAFVVVVGAGVVAAAAWLYQALEGDFLPEEDKGRLFCFVSAPEGATPEYTTACSAKWKPS
jgi:multidrug efflux pump